VGSRPATRRDYIGAAFIVFVGLVGLTLRGLYPNSAIMQLAPFILLYSFLAISLYLAHRENIRKQKLGYQTGLLAKEGTVVSTTGKAGVVRIRGELWAARSFGDREELAEGDTVLIRRVEGLTLFVERTASQSKQTK